METCTHTSTANCETELDTSSDVRECCLATDSFCGSRNGSMDKQMSEFGAERLHLADEYSRLKQQHSETSWWSSVSPLLDSYQQLVQIMSERTASFVKLYSGLVCPNCKVPLESESSTDDGSLNSSAVSSVISMLHGKSKSDCLPRDQLASGMSNCDCSSSVQLLTGKLVPECNGNSVGCNNAAGVLTRDAECACDSRLHNKESSDTCSVNCVAESSMDYGKNEEVSAGLDDEHCFSSNGVNHSNSASEMLSSCVMKRQSNETKDCHSKLNASDMQQDKASLSEDVVDNGSCQEIDLKVRDFKPDADSVVQSIVCAADSLKTNKSPSCDPLDDRQPVDDLDKFESELEKNGVDNRKQVRESTETYASIIGREIAASFSLHVDSSKSPCTGACVEPDGCSCASFDEDLPPRLTNGFDHLISTQNGIQTVVPHDILKVDPDAMDLSPSLDTVEVAQKVRDVLTANNVGQRQFARHVLGLSQGTVSELLAKPKPWDRLSEKGRESYRRMHEWVGDQRGVTTLKTALRRKVDSLSILNLSKHDNDAKLATEQRIALILSEAQRAMLQQQQPLQTELDIKNLDNVISVTVETGLKSSASSPATSSGKNSEIRPAPSRLKRDRRRGGATSSDAVTSSGTAARSGRRSAVLSTTEAVITTSTTTTSPARDLVARIYEEELRKLIAAAELNGNASDVAMYNRELARLAFSKAGCSTGNCTSSGMESDAAEVAENKENCDGGSAAILRDDSLSLDGPQDLSMSRNNIEQSEHCTTAVSDSSANSCLSSEDDEKQVGADGLSPLQRMQCIANSLPVAPSLSQASLTGQPSRPALPPISTEQLATCDDINTDDLVSKIKDVLGQFSISQRLFGEAVLGLSQGSVSDLLARPKPWPLLTQKGREPFVRMQAFLDDPDAISKLVATQYRVPADKLLRSNSSSDSSRSEGNAQLGSGSCTSLPPASTSSVVFTSFSPIASTSFRGPLQIDAALNGRLPEISPVPVNGCFSSLTGMPPLSGCTTPVMPGGVGSTVMPMGAAVFPFLPVASYFSSPPGHVAPMMMAVDFRQLFAQQLVSSVPLALTTNKVEKVEPLPSSEVFDTTLAGDEIDTQELTARVRDVLQANGLGQKLFGEAVLELSQGSVSELLAKPKPWNLLSAKGREPFLRMRTWLGDPQGIERLRTYQSQAVTGSKRKVSPDSGNESSSGQTVSTPQKRPRLFFTEDQKTALRNAYAADPYPNQAAIERLAADVGVGVKTVVNWFHNHRMRAKQQTTHGSSGDPCPASVASPSSGVSALNNPVPGELEEDTTSSCEQSAILSKTRILSSPCLSDPACQFPDRTSTDAQNQMLTASIDGYNNIANRSTVINKRKRARPHRLLAQRTMREKVDGTTSECVSSNDSQPYGDRDVPIDLSVLHSASKSENIKADLASDGQDEATVSETTPLANEEWKDEDRDREKNIERLQKNLSQEPAEEWEF